MPTKEINISVTNTLPITTQISIFGGPQDPNKNSVNAYTLYTWDTNLVNFSANYSFTIESKRSFEPTYTIIEGTMKNSFLGLVYGLNQLNIGMWWYDNSNTIYTSSDAFVFGNLVFPV